MKKTFIILAVLGTFSLVSCKKAYDCTCTTSSTTSFSTVPGGYDAATIAAMNSAEAADEAQYPSSETTVTSMEKTSKGSLNAACASSTDTQSNTETNYKSTTVTTTDCSSKKK